MTMQTKTKGIIFFVAILIYHLIRGILANNILQDYSTLLWATEIILIVLFILWIHRNTDFFKKMPLKERSEYRIRMIEETGIFQVGRIILSVGCFIFIGLGIVFLFLDRPDKLTAFLSLTIIGLIGLVIAFFVGRKSKNSKPNL